VFEMIGTLIMLVFLQVVLGFDNLLYISIESKRVEESEQKRVRQLGVIIAIVLRIVLLFVIFFAIQALEGALFEIDWKGFIEATSGCFIEDSSHQLTLLPDVPLEACTAEGQVVHGGISGHFIIVLLGGGFILYTAIKEIMHMLSIEQHAGASNTAQRTPKEAIFWIVVMNLVFSFDSILAAIPLTKGIGSNLLQLGVMGTAIAISGAMMLLLADRVSDFLKKNRMYEVLGLFILFLVGVMLVTEAGHLANLKLMGNEVHAMNKSTFYFVLIVLVLVDVAQSRYQKKLSMELQGLKNEEESTSSS
jgi:predicted tellurium resistance membrane protein TerC